MLRSLLKERTILLVVMIERMVRLTFVPVRRRKEMIIAFTTWKTTTSKFFTTNLSSPFLICTKVSSCSSRPSKRWKIYDKDDFSFNVHTSRFLLDFLGDSYLVLKYILPFEFSRWFFLHSVRGRKCIEKAPDVYDHKTDITIENSISKI